MMLRKKYLLGGLVARGLTAATKKFLKEGSKNFLSLQSKKELLKVKKLKLILLEKQK